MATVIKSSADPDFERKRQARFFDLFSDTVTKIGFYYQNKKDREEERIALEARQDKIIKEEREHKADLLKEKKEYDEGQIERAGKAQTKVAQTERDRQEKVSQESRDIEEKPTEDFNALFDTGITSSDVNASFDAAVTGYEREKKEAEIQATELLARNGLTKDKSTGAIIPFSQWQVRENIRLNQNQNLLASNRLSFEEKKYANQFPDAEKMTDLLANRKKKLLKAESSATQVETKRNSTLLFSKNVMNVYGLDKEDEAIKKKFFSGTDEAYTNQQTVMMLNASREELNSLYTKQLTQQVSQTDEFGETKLIVRKPSDGEVRELVDQHQQLMKEFIKAGDVKSMERIPYAIKEATDKYKGVVATMDPQTRLDYEELFVSVGGRDRIQVAQDAYIRDIARSIAQDSFTPKMNDQEAKQLSLALDEYTTPENNQAFTDAYKELFELDPGTVDEVVHDSHLIAFQALGARNFIRNSEGRNEPTTPPAHLNLSEGHTNALANYVITSMGGSDFDPNSQKTPVTERKPLPAITPEESLVVDRKPIGIGIIRSTLRRQKIIAKAPKSFKADVARAIRTQNRDLLEDLIDSMPDKNKEAVEKIYFGE